MTGALVVHLNRGSLHAVEPAVERFEAEGSFDLELHNHGQAVHVHLRLDDDLAAVAAVEETNHFVDTGATETVRVRARGTGTGALEVVTGYGNASERIAVRVGESGEGRARRTGGPERSGAASSGGGPASVGESLERPRPDEPLPGSLPELVTREGRARVVGLGALAVVLAGVSVVVAPSAVVAAGALAVLVGVAVAGYLLAG